MQFAFAGSMGCVKPSNESTICLRIKFCKFQAPSRSSTTETCLARSSYPNWRARLQAVASCKFACHFTARTCTNARTFVPFRHQRIAELLDRLSLFAAIRRLLVSLTSVLFGRYCYACLSRSVHVRDRWRWDHYVWDRPNWFPRNLARGLYLRPA